MITAVAQVDVSRNGTLVYTKRQPPAGQTLVWLDKAGSTQPLRNTAAQYDGLRLSPDGKRLAVGILDRNNSDLWVHDWERDISTRLTFEPGFDGYPVWTPDGKHLAFTSASHGGQINLYWMRADGGGEKPVRLTQSKNQQWPASFSPDGKRLAFQELNEKGKTEIWTISLDDVETDHPKPGKPEPFLVTPFNEMAPAISPDGRWLAYMSDESGTVQIYVRPFPGPGGKWQVSTGGGRFLGMVKNAGTLLRHARRHYGGELPCKRRCV